MKKILFATIFALCVDGTYGMETEAAQNRDGSGTDQIRRSFLHSPDGDIQISGVIQCSDLLEISCRELRIFGAINADALNILI
ncbi:MAG: hypothetical protein LBB21_05430 [Holosporaceae bacterium]|jgi:hypothetical protein|nr:hypothetical protein [Holosporaceae bacterium]